jgi:hypothetical protein
MLWRGEKSLAHLWLGLSNVLFLSGIQTKTVRAYVTSPMRAACPVQLIKQLIEATSIINMVLRESKNPVGFLVQTKAKLQCKVKALAVPRFERGFL